MTLRLSLLSISLFFATACFASSPAFVGTTGLGPGSAACSFSTIDADILAEGFEGAYSGYDNSGWTETIAGGTSDVDPDTAHPGTLACTDKCNHALKIVFDGTNQATSASAAFTAQSTLYTQFYLYIGAEGLADTDVQYFIGARNTASGTVWRVGLYQAAGGQLQLKLGYYPEPGSPSDYGTLSNVSVETWYRVAVKWVVGGASKFYVDGVEVGAGFTGGTASIDYISLGWHVAPDETMTVYFDNLKVDNDTMPGACPE